eukprot:1378309-Rhodomonas_salina.1
MAPPGLFLHGHVILRTCCEARERTAGKVISNDRRNVGWVTAVCVCQCVPVFTVEGSLSTRAEREGGGRYWRVT